MPNYSFKCLDCGERFTVSLSISERKNAYCEKCKSRRIEQIFNTCNTLGGKGSSCSSGDCSTCKGCSC